jgi:hypothetical protein
MIFPFAEGQGDAAAIQILAQRVLKDNEPEKLATNPVHIQEAWRVGHVQNLLTTDASKWIRFLKAATRKRASAVLLVLDGDRLGGQCPVDTARKLAYIAKQQGAGVKFSVAVVFAMQEVESWFIADAVALLGGPAGRTKKSSPIVLPECDLEKSPRDAKRWLSENMPNGYMPTIHQVDFARLVDFQRIRARNLRSFQRFEQAVVQLFNAVHSGSHIATPETS